jgi:hypothetical protein
MYCTPGEDDTLSGTGIRCGVFVMGVPLDEAAVRERLALQQELVVSRHRGNLKQLHEWSPNCPTLSGALRNSGSVALLLREDDLLLTRGNHLSEDAVYQARLSHYGGTPMNLHPEDFLHAEIAWDKPRGTGCLVAPDRILTAKHVVDSTMRTEIGLGKWFVGFDFKVQPDGCISQFFRLNDNLFRIKAEGPGGQTSEKLDDWATLVLENPASDPMRCPATIDGSSFDSLTAVYTLGHPQALTMRYAYSPEVLPSSFPGCAEAYVDGYCGGSGSPVFDAVTHKVVGLLTNSGASSFGADPSPGDVHLSQVTARQLGSGGSVFIGARSFACNALAPLARTPAP